MKKVNRRTLLFSCAAAGATAVLLSNTRTGSSRPNTDAQMTTVRERGALGDGVTDDSPAFNRTAKESDAIRVPAGRYLLESPIALRSGQTLLFDAGVIITAGSYMDTAIFDADGADGIHIVGNGVVIDLGEKTDTAIRIRGTEDRKAERCRVSDITVVGRSLTSDPDMATSAIDLTHLVGAVASNIHVDGYGHRNRKDAEQGYSVGLFYCVDPKIDGLRVTNGNIGLEIYQCEGVQVSSFSIRNCIDNGVYILSGSTSVKLSQGTVDACEEGVVIRSDDVTLSNIEFLNCSNKGISLRKGRRGKIEACHFESNRTHIGDDREEEPTTNLSVRNSTFWNAREQVINLLATTDSDFDGLDVHDTTASYTSGLIRLNNAKRCSIRNSRFNNPGKEIAIMIRLSHAAADVVISDNIFTQAHIAIDLFEASGTHPRDTRILNNTFLDVDIPVNQSQAVTGTIERPNR